MSTAEPLFEISHFPLQPQSKSEFDFLSPERQQKYDLLVHLLANLGQPVFLSGPEGIGKSTFLKQLCDHLPAGYRAYWLDASSEVDLEQIQKAFIDSRRAEDIAVVVLDDAGCLSPGALDALCRKVQAAKLNLVAALRPDELHLKAVSDLWAVGEAQVIELPPLTEQQCAAYLERLWRMRGRSGEPAPELARELYQRTHGVPGLIDQEVLALLGRPPLRWHPRFSIPVYLALGVVGSAVIALTYWQGAKTPPDLPPDNQVEVAAPKPQMAAAPEIPSSSASAPSAEISPPAASALPQAAVSLSSPVQEAPRAPQLPAPEVVAEALSKVEEVPKPPANHLADSGKPKTLPVDRQNSPVPKLQSPDQKVLPAVKEPPVAEVKQPQAAEPPKAQDVALSVAKAAGVQSRDWVLKQPGSHFALQVGFSRNPQELAAFARRHPKLRPLAYYPKGNGYVILYGAFRSLDEVQKATRKLPPEISQASIWRFKSIQDTVRSQPANP